MGAGGSMESATDEELKASVDGLTPEARARLVAALGEPAEPAPAAPLAERGSRFIITGNDADGNSFIVSEDRVSESSHPFCLVDAARETPLGAVAGPRGSDAPDGGAPGALALAGKGPSVAAGGFKVVNIQFDPKPADTPPGWHRTETVDFLVVVAGKVVLSLDKGQTTCAKGDVIVQRNSNHGWQNPFDEPCICVGMLHALK